MLSACSPPAVRPPDPQAAEGPRGPCVSQAVPGRERAARGASRPLCGSASGGTHGRPRCLQPVASGTCKSTCKEHFSSSFKSLRNF